MSKKEDVKPKLHSWSSIDDELVQAALVSIRDVLRLKESEEILIITNNELEVLNISHALYRAAAEVGAAPVLIVQPLKTQLDFAEDSVINAIACEPDVILSISKEKMGKDRHAIAHPYEWEGASYDHIFDLLLRGKKRIRGFWSPGITREMFIKAVPINYEELNAICARLKKLLDNAASIHITNENGTDFRTDISGRAVFSDDGNFSRPGNGGNIPAGEVFVSPVVGKSEGTIVYDGSISVYNGDIVIEAPISVVVEDGFVRNISGKQEADELLQTIQLGENQAVSMEKEGKLPPGQGKIYKRNARNIGEIGIGLNPSAEIIGNMLEDEKAFHTCHIAIGSNYEEDAPALIHVDGLITKPSIALTMRTGQEITIMRNGDLLPD